MLFNTVRASGLLMVLALLANSPAAAQVTDAGGFVCALVNFRFCDQPAAPLPATEAEPQSRTGANADHRNHRRKQATAPER